MSDDFDKADATMPPAIDFHFMGDAEKCHERRATDTDSRRPRQSWPCSSASIVTAGEPCAISCSATFADRSPAAVSSSTRRTASPGAHNAFVFAADKVMSTSLHGMQRRLRLIVRFSKQLWSRFKAAPASSMLAMIYRRSEMRGHAQADVATMKYRRKNVNA